MSKQSKGKKKELDILNTKLAFGDPLKPELANDVLNNITPNGAKNLDILNVYHLYDDFLAYIFIESINKETESNEVYKIYYRQEGFINFFNPLELDVLTRYKFITSESILADEFRYTDNFMILKFKVYDGLLSYLNELNKEDYDDEVERIFGEITSVVKGLNDDGVIVSSIDPIMMWIDSSLNVIPTYLTYVTNTEFEFTKTSAPFPWSIIPPLIYINSGTKYTKDQDEILLRFLYFYFYNYLFFIDMAENFEKDVQKGKESLLNFRNKSGLRVDLFDELIDPSLAIQDKTLSLVEELTPLVKIHEVWTGFTYEINDNIYDNMVPELAKYLKEFKKRDLLSALELLYIIPDVKLISCIYMSLSVFDNNNYDDLRDLDPNIDNNINKIIKSMNSRYRSRYQEGVAGEKEAEYTLVNIMMIPNIYYNINDNLYFDFLRSRFQENF